MNLTRLSILGFIFSSMTAYCLAADAEVAVAGNTQAQIATSKAMMNDPVKPKCPVTDVQPATSPTPPAMVKFDNCAMPFLTADYLFWTARQDNMSYVTQLNTETENQTSNPISYPDWEWGSGFRVGLGLNFNHDGWDTYLNYTWFCPETSRDKQTLSDTEALTNTLFPTWNASLFAELVSGLITEASQKWKFKFNNLDWELGRNFFISRYLTLRPFGGLKTAWQKQTQRLSYLQITDDPIGTRTFNMRNVQDFWGIGIRIGLNSAWYVYKKYLSIVADLAFSTLWTNYENKQKQITIFEGLETVSMNIKDSFHAIRPVIEADLGAQWEYWFDDDAMKFSLRAVWEEQVWWSQNNLGEFVSLAATYKGRGGDLYLQGLTIRARFDF